MKLEGGLKTKYTEEDLANLVALCEQEGGVKTFNDLKNRLQKSLAYRDVRLRLTKHDKELLQSLYDSDMDINAKETLKKILN